jgi:hypothetical protein
MRQVMKKKMMKTMMIGESRKRVMKMMDSPRLRVSLKESNESSNSCKTIPNEAF